MSTVHKFYVHYHALSYLKNEHQAKNFPFYTYAQQRAQKLAKQNSLSSGMSKQQKEEYLEVINALTCRSSIPSAIDPKLVAYEQGRIETIMEGKLKNKLTLDKVSGKVSKIMASENLDAADVPAQQIMQKEAISDTKLNEILKEVTKIKTAVSKDLLSGQLDTSKSLSIEDLTNIEVRLQNMINSAEDLIKRDAEGNQIGYIKPYAAAHKDKRWYLRSNEEAVWLKEINTLIQQYKVSSKTVTTIQGDYFEEVAASAARVCVGSAEKWVIDKTTDAVQEFVGRAVGGKSVSMKFRLDGINLASYDRVFANMLSQEKIITDTQGNRYMILENYSQGKVDVEAQFPLETSIDNRKLQPVNISVKSYSDLSSLGAVNGTSLWTFLQNENSYYIKAYLNTLSWHSAFSEGRVWWSRSGERQAVAALIRQSEEAVWAQKILTAYRALTGDTLGRSKAQIFLVNDASKHQVHLLEMVDIFNFILARTKASKTAIDKYFNFYHSLDAHSFYENEWHPAGADARVGEILQQAHAHKLSVAFKPKELLSDPQVTIIR